MRTLILCLLLTAWTASANAQQAPLSIDRDLWQGLSQALANISMPLAAHQQAQQIMQNVEQEAVKRAATQKEPAK